MKLRTLLAALLAVPLALAIQVAAPVAAHGSQSSCIPKADLPTTSNGSAEAHVWTTGCSSSDTYTYEVRLSTTSGTILSGYQVTGAHGNISAYAPIVGFTSCNGQQVRSFIWMNINGQVKSNQNPTTGGISC